MSNRASRSGDGRRRDLRPWASALALVAAVLLAAPASATADPMYWGGTIKGEVYGMQGEAPTNPAVLSRFEADAGKQVTVVNTGQGWGSFDTTTMNAAISAGTIPLVTMGLPSTVTLKEVAEGKQDAAIRSWARAAKAFAYPFLFRPWWEPNGGWYEWGRSDDYVPAWRHFHDLVVAEGASNVTWAWVVNTIWSDPESLPEPWYPGDAYVDWVGMDAYNWGENPLQPDRWLSAEESIEPTLDELERIAPGKPVCICESGSTEIGNGGPSEQKPLWIHEMLDQYLPSHPQIKAYFWFNWNVEHGGNGSGGGRWDWQIESSPGAEAAFREGIQGDTFLSVLPTLTPLTKVPVPAKPAPPVEAQQSSNSSPSTADSASKPAESRSARKNQVDGGNGGNLLVVGRARPNPRTGTTRLSLALPGPGRLLFSGRALSVRVLPSPRFARVPFSKWAGAGGQLVLEVAATGGKLDALAATGASELALSVRYTPLEGRPQQTTTKLSLRSGRP